MNGYGSGYSHLGESSLFQPESPPRAVIDLSAWILKSKSPNPKSTPWAPNPISKTRKSTWRFMHSYKWSYKSLIWAITIVTLLILISPLVTPHEPPSSSSFIYWKGSRLKIRFKVLLDVGCHVYRAFHWNEVVYRFFSFGFRVPVCRTFNW